MPMDGISEDPARPTDPADDRMPSIGIKETGGALEARNQASSRGAKQAGRGAQQAGGSRQ